MTTNNSKVKAVECPQDSVLRAVLPILVGVKKSSLTQLIQTLSNNMGTPQSPLDWSNPDEWIAERLTGYDAELARIIWENSLNKANPRYLRSWYLFMNAYNLLAPDETGAYRLTERGVAYLKEDPATIRALDEEDGRIKLLSILASKSKAKRSDLLPEWSEFVMEQTNYSSPHILRNTLYQRLRHLIERGLVTRDGAAYEITEAGLRCLSEGNGIEPDPRREVLRAAKAFNVSQREKLREALGVLDPYAFEGLIATLLEAMGYDDVTVTKQSGDKGVDVTAKIQFGITTVREVVQVKRFTKGSITRQVIDQLRGSLIYHQAIRGTLITLGPISKGAEEAAVYPGAAPITLIDGSKLLDLLIEHDIGIRKREVTLWELDLDDLTRPTETDVAVEV